MNEEMREKVVRGLECCLNRKCKECPFHIRSLRDAEGRTCVYRLIEAARAVVAVDAAPAGHGHWVPDTWRGNDIMSGGSMATCSECGKGWLDTRRMRFCPCCGAKMDE